MRDPPSARGKHFEASANEGIFHLAPRVVRLVGANGAEGRADDGALGHARPKPRIQYRGRHVVPAAVVRNLHETRIGKTQSSGVNSSLREPHGPDVRREKNPFSVEQRILHNATLIRCGCTDILRKRLDAPVFIKPFSRSLHERLQ